MHQEFLMGNEAIAMGAIAAGVNLVCGYPGTPSTEVLETVAKHRGPDCYVEWSVNEKVAMEIAGGAAYSGARALVTMKQMGLNVASDPLMCLSYIGVKGGLVVLVADDPGPISSQTEQDSRTFAAFAKVPVFDPSGAQEAYEMIQDAFEFSEKYQTPVFLRPTTRVSHGYASISVKDPEEYTIHTPEGFVKDSSRWVIFPRLSTINHKKIEERNEKLRHVLSDYDKNCILRDQPGAARSQNQPDDASAPQPRRGLAAGGFNFTYALESLRALKSRPEAPLLKVATPFPFPEDLALQFLEGLDEVLCIEELDPVIERELTYLCGKHHLKTRILGKLTGHMPLSGENNLAAVQKAIADFLNVALPASEALELPPLPVRPPVLCAGCPHRASFYAVKQAMKGEKTIYCGDIGASAIPSVVNAVYNQAEMTLIVLDNSTTAMTGHQPHPGTGRTMMGEVVAAVSIEQVLKGIGLTCVKTVDPLNHALAVETVKDTARQPGVKAIIFKSPCIAITRPSGRVKVDAAACIGCRKCIRELGCPALLFENGKALIDTAQCTGCGLCSQICPVQAIQPEGGSGND